MLKIQYGNIILVTLLILINPILVKAETNHLYISNSNNELYYDTNKFNKNLFMYHIDMLPGKIYQDELIIENDSNTNYSLYLKIKNDEIEESSLELLQNIIMKIYLDDKLIYEGTALGIDYIYNNYYQEDSIYIGNYNTKDKSLLTVETKLNNNYTNTDNRSLSTIDWQFIAIDNQANIVNPNTKDNISKVLRIILLSFIILIYSLYKLQNKNYTLV